MRFPGFIGGRVETVGVPSLVVEADVDSGTFGWPVVVLVGITAGFRVGNCRFPEENGCEGICGLNPLGGILLFDWTLCKGNLEGP